MCGHGQAGRGVQGHAPTVEQPDKPAALPDHLPSPGCLRGACAGLYEGLSLTTVMGGDVQSGLPAGALLSAPDPHPSGAGPSPF